MGKALGSTAETEVEEYVGDTDRIKLEETIENGDRSRSKRSI